ncbi:sporulation protein YjcZ [Bacillus cereus]|nr:hypothetical protein BK786_27720 [Bacillus thuringiensis serovar thailandensis]PEF55854.1 sporulation protein YjcZ [Bacillus cereus]PFN33537.1 sporulation protein YjcZ [Bacillus cereus]
MFILLIIIGAACFC